MILYKWSQSLFCVILVWSFNQKVYWSLLTERFIYKIHSAVTLWVIPYSSRKPFAKKTNKKKKKPNKCLYSIIHGFGFFIHQQWWRYFYWPFCYFHLWFCPKYIMCIWFFFLYHTVSLSLILSYFNVYYSILLCNSHHTFILNFLFCHLTFLVLHSLSCPSDATLFAP